jgi:flagellar basal body-associated protein FliL
MSDDEEKKTVAEPAKRGGAAGMLVGLILPAVLSGGASYGGVRAASKGAPPADAHAAPREAVRPPGLTVPLEPFVVTVYDTNDAVHPLKLTVAIEFDLDAKEDTVKMFIPRIRDAVLGHVRTLSFEEASETQRADKLRVELLERCRSVGAASAERVLITDMVMQ